MKEGNLFFSKNIAEAGMANYFDGNLQQEVENYYLRLPAGLQKVIKYIWKNYNKPLYAKTLAKQAGIKNESYFGKVFKKKLGCSCTCFINGVRVKIAKEKLANTNCSITEIANQVGFKDISSFHRVFLSIENMSPSSFRKELIAKAAIRQIPVGKKIELLNSMFLADRSFQ